MFKWEQQILKGRLSGRCGDKNSNSHWLSNPRVFQNKFQKFLKCFQIYKKVLILCNIYGYKAYTISSLAHKKLFQRWISKWFCIPVLRKPVFYLKKSGFLRLRNSPKYWADSVGVSALFLLTKTYHKYNICNLKVRMKKFQKLWSYILWIFLISK